MAKPITPDDIRKLLDAGYSLTDIAEFTKEPNALDTTLSRLGSGSTYSKPPIPLKPGFKPLPQSGNPATQNSSKSRSIRPMSKTAVKSGSGLASFIAKLI